MVIFTNEHVIVDNLSEFSLGKPSLGKYICTVKNKPLKLLIMKRILSTVVIVMTALLTQAAIMDNGTTIGSGEEVAFHYSPDKQLQIDIPDEMAGGSITVSIFNKVGEIVMDGVLGLGLNQVEVDGLEKGKYVAVVRMNDEYKSKTEFYVY